MGAGGLGLLELLPCGSTGRRKERHEVSDYIKRTDAIDAVCGWGPNDLTEAIRADIETIPAADVRPVRRGKWILYKDRDSTGKFEYVQWSCSACKSNVRTGQPRFDSTLRERPRFNYCPNCGADMREES